MVNSTRMGYYEASSSFGTNQQGDVLKSCLHGLIQSIFEAGWAYQTSGKGRTSCMRMHQP